MSKYTADDVKNAAWRLGKTGTGIERVCAMLDDLARRLRQEEEEAKRDPVTDPRPGDRIEIGKNTCVWMATGMVDFNAESKDDFAEWAEHPGATIIRRRESP